MTDTTPRCGSNSEARKRLAEKASTPDDREALKNALVGTSGAGAFFLADHLLKSEWLAEHDAQVRAEALDVCAALLDRVVTYWGGRPLSAGHGVNLYADVRDVLRGIERDRDHNRAIARQSVEGGGEDV